MIVNQKLLANLFKTTTKEINNFCKKDLTIIDPNRILIDNKFNNNIKYISVGSL